VELQLLGPVEARHDGVLLDLGSPKQQIVLAVLALNAGRHVSTDRLVYELWGERPIVSAVENTRGYTASLRRVFEAADRGGIQVVRGAGGYRLELNRATLDLDLYEADASEGRAAAAAGDLERAAATLERARTRWLGAMLEGLPRGPTLEARCAVAEQDLVNLVDSLAEVHLGLGHPEHASALLQEQIHSHNLRERSYELLMRARYQIDGPAAATAVFDQARENLRTELGVDPGPDLRELHRRVLDRDPALALSRDRVAVAAPLFAPRQLPATAACFVGRADEMKRLGEALAHSNPADRYRPVVAVVFGPGGAGKSALNLQVAHQVSDRFPDGQLYVDLFGSTLNVRPPTTIEVVQRLLHALGVQEGRAPASVDEAAALLRSLTAGRRVLVVVDNATSADQVVPLLPGAGGCGVLVSSRRPLASLNADLRIRLGGLPEADALKLLGTLTSESRIDEDDVGDAIVANCAALPLAIRIAAARLATNPHLEPRELATRLAARPLDELQHDDLAVRTSIRVSYESLEHRSEGSLAAQAFRLLGLLPVPTITSGLLAAILPEHSPDAVHAALEELVDAQLLDAAPSDRYQVHDLVREAATEFCAERHNASQRAHFLRKAVAYYAAATHEAMQVAQAGAVWLHGPEQPAATKLPTFVEPSQAGKWVDSELGNLLSMVDVTSSAAADPDVRHEWLSLCGHLWERLNRRGHWHTAARVAKLVLDTAARHEEEEIAALGHLLSGRSIATLGRHDEAITHLNWALEIMRPRGNTRGTCLVLNALGVASTIGGDPVAALDYLNQGLAALPSSDMDQERALLLLNLSATLHYLDRFDDAERAARACITLCREHGYTHRLGAALSELAGISLSRGVPADAVGTATEAITYGQSYNHELPLHSALLIRSAAYVRLGDHVAALADVEQALTRARDIGNCGFAAAALRQRARILASDGRGEHAAGHDSIEDGTPACGPVWLDPVLERVLERCTTSPQGPSSSV
jgi:DNA-binding SARP family transcriptional activator/tetratricopeptide (TPR) repeat protein